MWPGAAPIINAADTSPFQTLFSLAYNFVKASPTEQKLSVASDGLSLDWARLLSFSENIENPGGVLEPRSMGLRGGDGESRNQSVFGGLGGRWDWGRSRISLCCWDHRFLQHLCKRPRFPRLAGAVMLQKHPREFEL